MKLLVPSDMEFWIFHAIRPEWMEVKLAIQNYLQCQSMRDNILQCVFPKYAASFGIICHVLNETENVLPNISTTSQSSQVNIFITTKGASYIKWQKGSTSHPHPQPRE